MVKIDFIIQLSIVLLIASMFGYVFAVMKEYFDFKNKRVVIKSKIVNQDYLDNLDLQIFKIGHIRLKSGDIIKIYSSFKENIQGTVLGAQKEENSVILLLKNDEIVTYKISDINKLRVISRYGSLF